MQQTIDTLAELKAIRFSVFDEIFCKETSREYFFKQDGGLTPDDLEIVTTAQGGNWRLVAKTGKGGGADGAGTIASQAEAEAGTENTKAMSALRTAQAIAAQVVSPVSSVHGRTGAVTAQAGDYAAYYGAVKTYITSQATPSRVTGSAPTALGQYRSYLRNAGARTYTETNGSPTTAPSSSNGYKLYDGNVYASADTNNEPTKYEIYIGTGKTPAIEFYSSAGRTGFVSVQPLLYGGIYDSGCIYNYDPTTGIFTILKQHAGGYDPAIGLDASGVAFNAAIYFDIKC